MPKNFPTLNGVADYQNTYGYDFLDRETSVSQQGQSGGDAVAPKLVDLTYTYDHAGQLTGATATNDPSADEGYQYDATGNRQSTTAGSTTTTSSTGANNTLVSDRVYDYQCDALLLRLLGPGDEHQLTASQK